MAAKFGPRRGRGGGVEEDGGKGEGRSWHLMHSQPKPLFLGPRVLCSGAGSQPQGETGSRGGGLRGEEGSWGEEKAESEKSLEKEVEIESLKEREGAGGSRSRCGGYEYGYMHSGRQENRLFLFTLFFKDLFISDIEQELALEASRGGAEGEGEGQTPL